MSSASMLTKVKSALGIGENTALDDTLTEYIDETIAFIKGAGVPESAITAGLVARGVSDLWNYGSGGGQLSEYFKLRTTQLALNNK